MCAKKVVTKMLYIVNIWDSSLFKVLNCYSKFFKFIQITIMSVSRWLIDVE